MLNVESTAAEQIADCCCVKLCLTMYLSKKTKRYRSGVYVIDAILIPLSLYSENAASNYKYRTGSSNHRKAYVGILKVQDTP